MAYVNLVCKTHNSNDDGEELKPQDGCLVDIFLVEHSLIYFRSDTTCS